MRSPIATLVAVTLSGTFACTAVDPPTAPTAPTLSLSELSSPSGRRDPFDVSGDWIPSTFYFWDWLPGTEQVDENLVHCASYAYIENEEWNALRLQQDGTHIVGASLPNMGIDCFTYGVEGIGWYVDIDDTFEGQVQGGEVRLSLNRYIEVRVAPDPNGVTLSGTIRVRMDPRPIAEPYWVEQPISLSPWYSFP